MLIDNIVLFRHIVERGSLVGAARETSLSTTAVSQRLASLEKHYGVVLLNRTTRSISLTPEGRTLFNRSRNLLNEISDLDSRIRLGAKTLIGKVRVSAPSDLGRTRIAPMLDQFIKNHSEISIDLLLSDRSLDIVGEGIDLALRFGHPGDSSLRTRGLGTWRRIVCASPGYLDKHALPVMPDDLKAHNCLVMRFGDNLDNVWKFGSGNSRASVRVSGNRNSNDGAMVKNWCLSGYGIAYKSELDVAADIEAGRLLALLENFAAPGIPLQMLFPPSRAQPRRISALADHITDSFRSI